MISICSLNFTRKNISENLEKILEIWKKFWNSTFSLQASFARFRKMFQCHYACCLFMLIVFLSVANLSSIFGSQRIFEVAYEQLASRPFAAIFDLFKKLDITFSIETVNWIVENMMRADKETDSSHQSSYSTDERNAQAEALKWKTDSGRELQKGFEQDPFCQKLSSLKQLS